MIVVAGVLFITLLGGPVGITLEVLYLLYGLVLTAALIVD